MRAHHRIVSLVPSPDTAGPFVYSFRMEQFPSAHPKVQVHPSPTCPPPREPPVCSLCLWVLFPFRRWVHLCHILDSTCKWYHMVFKILKEDAVKVLRSICQQIWTTQQWPLDWKRSDFIPIPNKGNAKECSDYHTIALIPHASKVIQNYSKPGFNSMWIENFQMFKPNLEKAEEPEIKLPTSVGSSKKQGSSRKASTSALVIRSKPLCGSQQTVGNS